MTRSLPFIMVWLFAVTFISTASAQSVSVFALDGSRADGELLECRDGKIVARTEKGPVEWSFPALERIEVPQKGRTESDRPTKGGMKATLVDGSVLICRSFVGRDDRWKAESSSGAVWDLPKGTVETLLLKTLSSALESEWQKALSDDRSSDEMVIARPGETIDRAAGIVVALNAEQAEFSFDGQVLQAPLEKLVGLCWYRPRERRVEPAIQVGLRDGSRWEASQLSLIPAAGDAGTELKWVTPSGVEASAKWLDVREVNFSAANVVWLANQTALSRKTFQRKLFKEPYAGRDAMLGPRFISSDGSGRAKSQDLEFVGPGEISFRIPQGFQRFVTKVRRAEHTRFATAVRCQVWVGDDLAWDKVFSPQEMEVAVDIPVVPDKRLRVVVECDSDLLLGTQLSWLQPRLTR